MVEVLKGGCVSLVIVGVISVWLSVFCIVIFLGDGGWVSVRIRLWVLLMLIMCEICWICCWFWIVGGCF